MCWLGKITDNHIAQKDVKCMKILTYDEYKKIYQPYFMSNKINKYEFNKIYETSLEKNKIKNDITRQGLFIFRGYHSYNTYLKVHVKRWHHGYEVNVINDITNYHARFTSFYSFRVILVECIIPKGSTYYENKNGEIVSNKLIITKEINLNYK